MSQKTDRRVVALTGATGFVGSHTLDALIAQGFAVHALTRRAQAERAHVTWVPGALDDEAALATLCRGSDAVLHIAGVVNAPDAAGFDKGNILGTHAIVHAAQQAGVSRFVHVSSLAAREPDLSDYCRSKAGAEDEVRGSDLTWTMVRPPGVYGPGDTEMLELFRMATKGVMLLPPEGRLSLIHVADLAACLVAMCGAGEETHGQLYEVDDGREVPLTHSGLAHAIGRALDRKVLPMHAPKMLLALAARGDRLMRGSKAKLTPDRARYLSHPDWSIDPSKRPPAPVWHPAILTDDGLAQTASWYRDQGWI